VLGIKVHVGAVVRVDTLEMGEPDGNTMHLPHPQRVRVAVVVVAQQE
jgi:hypothetical protein